MKKVLPKRKSPSKKKVISKKVVKESQSQNIALKSILVPTDFSEYSKKSLRYAVSFAKQFNASITLLYVVEPAVFPSDFGFAQINFPDMEKDMLEKAEQELKQIINEVNSELKITSAVRSGIPFVEVTSFAGEEKMDLIIVATHGRTGVEHILFGSTAEKIIRKAPCPVLVVRAEERDFVDERV